MPASVLAEVLPYLTARRRRDARLRAPPGASLSSCQRSEAAMRRSLCCLRARAAPDDARTRAWRARRRPPTPALQPMSFEPRHRAPGGGRRPGDGRAAQAAQPSTCKDFNNRKSQGLLELNRALRMLDGGAADDADRSRASPACGPSSRSTGACSRLHLEAVREISTVMADAIRDAESDGTYSQSIRGRATDGYDQADPRRAVGVRRHAGVDLCGVSWQCRAPSRTEAMRGGSSGTARRRPTETIKTQHDQRARRHRRRRQGYVMAQFVFTVDAKVMKSCPSSPTSSCSTRPSRPSTPARRRFPPIQEAGPAGASPSRSPRTSTSGWASTWSRTC